MTNKYDSILPNSELIQKLTKSEIQLYYFLVENKNKSPFTYSNEYLSEITGKRVETVSRYISNLKKLKLIEVRYISHKDGTKRIIKLANKNYEN